MSKRKWGESFLKSGLPLEHLTQVTLRSLGWHCEAQIEYTRPNRKGRETWFELDLFATSFDRGDTELSFLIECKYHDLSKFWVFLPHEPSRWHFDDRFLNCAPLQTLKEPREQTFLSLAPTSANPLVVSEDGTKQDNAAYTAIQQVVNGYVPWGLDYMFGYLMDADNFDPNRPPVLALIPMIVTNAKLYRLRTTVTDLDVIRSATAPAEIADELEWTWCFHNPSRALFGQNMEAIAAHKAREANNLSRLHGVEARMLSFAERPNWIAIVNISSLSKVITILSEAFSELDTRLPYELPLLKSRKRTNARRKHAV